MDGGSALLQGRDQWRAGIAVEFLSHCEVVEQGLIFGAVTGAARPGLCRYDQVAPLVGTRAGPREELIDTVILNLCFLCHRALPLACIGWSRSWSRRSNGGLIQIKPPVSLLFAQSGSNLRVARNAARQSREMSRGYRGSTLGPGRSHTRPSPHRHRMPPGSSRKPWGV